MQSETSVYDDSSNPSQYSSRDDFVQEINWRHDFALILKEVTSVQIEAICEDLKGAWRVKTEAIEANKFVILMACEDIAQIIAEAERHQISRAFKSEF